MKMNLFNFYLDDELKQQCINKLSKEIGETNKGTLAALIRVLLYQFAHTDKVNPLLLDAVKENYTLTTKKNKRSNL